MSSAHTSSLSATRLLLAGYGNMGGALLAAWARAGLLSAMELCVVDPKPELQIHAQGPVKHASLSTVADSWAPDTILLAVKPQLLPEVLPAYAQRFGCTPLYITIAAGRGLAFYAAALGVDARVMRAMPNTPAMIGEGMTVLCGNANVSEEDKSTAKQLFGTAGAVAIIDDEALMHAVTAISGCGPAYIFLLLEALVSAGMQQGLDETLARTLAEQTVSGAAALASASRGKTLEELREAVTSPGGATEAALRMLMEGEGLEGLIKRAVNAAASRSKALASG